MAEAGGDRENLEVRYNVERILDAHTHLTGQENAEEIIECMDFCGVEKAFVFAPMLNVRMARFAAQDIED
jgi:adenosine deaminase